MEKINSSETSRVEGLDYHALNAMLNLVGQDGNIPFDMDKLAVKKYFLDHVNENTVFFHDLKEKLNYLVKNDYYDETVIDMYSFAFTKRLFKKAYKYEFRFETFLGALKFYQGYALKNFKGDRYLERFEDRVCMVALYLAGGKEDIAEGYLEEMMTGRFQPATPTFLNCGKKQRGELVSCFLLRVEDNMESIGKAVLSSLQLSKRGGGVSLLLSNLRETGAPIKKIENQSSGVIPVMKMLEDAFSYANQLGARQGAGAVYLNVHHPDIMTFLDTKRENADEKIRIKTLSLGVVIPDVTFKLAKEGREMALFSPYDVERIYKTAFADISVTEMYDTLLADDRIRKTYIDPREVFRRIAEIQFESGYPYIMYEDTVNRANPIAGRINMSNLCSEILQVNTPAVLNEDSTYKVMGKDISCNLGSQNIAKAMESPDFGLSVERAIRALTAVSDMSDIASVPTVQYGNSKSHAIGLGQMNMHGYLASQRIHYGSEESLDFTNMYFYTVAFHALRTSNLIARERKEVFDGFEDSKYASGEYFDKYINGVWEPRTEKVRELFEKAGIAIPTPGDWETLKKDVMEFGIYNQNLQAIPPTGSISYINNSTASIHPVARGIEIRKEGKTGRIYFPAPYMTNENREYYKSAYDVGYKGIIDLYAEATQHVDQGLSLTLFMYGDVDTRELNLAQIYAFKKGIKTLYYVRLQQAALEGTQIQPTQQTIESCVSCEL
ncbi:ribonucleoside-diphosphate reductase large subunit [Erwinia phage pEa_SNUABM_56]|uniref:Ribonucleoside-diphosphate reductase n=1 Tax=Erwinia phage pEp_SNUABM_01 TaxID=2601643 RepID=A0A5J6DAV6_9CAUD|nr:ribonucleotide reductase large subunit [Erwinia phage pEp_SNUABM_01]QEQ94990.1 putative NrdA protein [Erwinia phage pEp_SNUABM_01]UYL84916.1 ribonucleoside-diphosphate reductase large subunit [Erwinia phage pEa_SNUABM_55]UYL85235.1 ribonucleoside-diphosphate reductase large subunit [Erwinia phage pEa_SNUABM_56]